MSPNQTVEVRRPEKSVGTPGSPAPAAPDGAFAELKRQLFVLGKRRTFLIHKRSQLRAGFLTAASALVLLLLLNLSLYSARQTVTERVVSESPELGQILHSQNRVELGLVLAASAVFLVGVFVVTVLETHKTAGAAFNLARHMDAMREGRYSTRLKLRRDDNLRELEESFNEMGRALQDRAWFDVERLQEFAIAAENLQGPEEARDLAHTLRGFAESKRRMAE